MDSTSGTMGVAAAGLLMTAAALARCGWRQKRFRGWSLWVAAEIAGAAGIILMPLSEGSRWAAAAAQALLLAWPLLGLAGLRRFHGRLGLPTSEITDWGVLAAACAMLALAASLSAGSVAEAWLPAAAALAVPLYAAAVMAGSRSTDDLIALRLLAVAVLLSALLPALDGTGGEATALASAFGLVVLGFTMLALMSERTERELRESRRRLRVLANTDPLTGVPNRRHFQELADAALRGAGDPPPVLLLLDIDHFKLLNDRLGHAAGDRALQLLGRCMQAALRADDIAGRLGGDEFALLLDGSTVEQAVGVADRVVHLLQAQSPGHRLPRLGLSFGIVQLRPGDDIDAALHRADLALYEAKRQGRSRAVSTGGAGDEPQFSESQRLGLSTS